MFKILVVVAVVAQIINAAPRSSPLVQKLSPEAAAYLAQWTPESKQKMWEMSGRYQGDIILTPNQMNGVIDTRYRWSNRVVPYEIGPEFSSGERSQIESAIGAYSSMTGGCISVQPRNGESDYVFITGENSGCWSYVGRLGGGQQLNLQRQGCIYQNTAQHEMLHALGFYHQQSATERDDYVDIMWNNIQSGQEHNFDKYGADVISSFGQTYDYGSVMHYGGYAFSSNGQPTIVPKDPNAVIGEASTLSGVDVAKLRAMYGC